jgi:hypothetical protein
LSSSSVVSATDSFKNGLSIKSEAAESFLDLIEEAILDLSSPRVFLAIIYAFFAALSSNFLPSYFVEAGQLVFKKFM